MVLPVVLLALRPRMNPQSRAMTPSCPVKRSPAPVSVAPEVLVPASANWPEKASTGSGPETDNGAEGLVVPTPTPPVARMRNWLLALEAKSAFVESAHTKAP